jgi:hypothetical protein
MQIGFNPPISGPRSDPDTVARVARDGEALGNTGEPPCSRVSGLALREIPE